MSHLPRVILPISVDYVFLKYILYLYDYKYFAVQGTAWSRPGPTRFTLAGMIWSCKVTLLSPAFAHKCNIDHKDIHTAKYGLSTVQMDFFFWQKGKFMRRLEIKSTSQLSNFSNFLCSAGWTQCKRANWQEHFKSHLQLICCIAMFVFALFCCLSECYSPCRATAAQKPAVKWQVGQLPWMHHFSRDRATPGSYRLGRFHQQIHAVQ